MNHLAWEIWISGTNKVIRRPRTKATALRFAKAEARRRNRVLELIEVAWDRVGTGYFLQAKIYPDGEVSRV